LSVTALSNGPVTVGEVLPTFGGWGLGGERISSRDFLGAAAKNPSNALVVSFFASWCEPCKKGLPLIDKVVRESDSQGYQALLIAFGEGSSKVEPFLDGLGLKYPTLLDEMKAVSGRLGVTSQLPVTYVIDGGGVVRTIFLSEGTDFEERFRVAMRDASQEEADATAP